MNTAFMVGRLVADPEARQTQSGVAVTSFRIAVQRRFKDSSGEKQSDFFSCVAWRQTAEFVAKYAHKGDLVAIKGELQNRSYDAQDGSKRTVTEIIVDEVQLCGASQNKQDAEPSSTREKAAAMFGAGFVEVDDSELPF